MPTPAKPAALTPARPEQPTMPTPNTAEHAAAEKKDCPTLTSRTLAPPNTSSKAQTGARARDAKSMPKATGRWTAEEHDEFLKCLDIYGREWKKVAERITTRTAAQIRSHAQKYFKKIEAAGEGAPKAARPAPTAAAADGAPQIPAETLAGALGALDDMLRALRSKRARYEDDDAAPSETGSDEAPPLEKRLLSIDAHVFPGVFEFRSAPVPENPFAAEQRLGLLPRAHIGELDHQLRPVRGCVERCIVELPFHLRERA